MTRRILLKLSGEALMGQSPFGIEPASMTRYVSEIVVALQEGVQVGIVVGGGNLFRGVQGTASGMDRTSADYMGMMATIMNGLALTDAFRSQGQTAQSFCSIEMPRVMEFFTKRGAEHAFDQGAVCIFSGGTGSPFFTTDTAAALKAAEIGADEVLKATQVDGVYESDPRENPTARRYDQLNFNECLTRGLKVMDSAAFSICQAEKIPLRVFDLHHAGHLTRALLGEPIGTLVGPGLSVRFGA
jgi:uridylate kinase